MSIEERIEALGLVLPPPPQMPPGIVLPFEAVKTCGDLAYVSGHIAQKPRRQFHATLWARRRGSEHGARRCRGPGDGSGNR